MKVKPGSLKTTLVVLSFGKLSGCLSAINWRDAQRVEIKILRSDGANLPALTNCGLQLEKGSHGVRERESERVVGFLEICAVINFTAL